MSRSAASGRAVRAFVIGIWSVVMVSIFCPAVHAQQPYIPPLEQVRNRYQPYSGKFIPQFSVACRLDTPETIDTVVLRVAYDLNVRIDTLHRRDRVVSEVGRRYTKFYSASLLQHLLNMTDREHSVVPEWLRGCRIMFPWTTYTDGKRITNHVLLPYTNDQRFEYEESVPKIAWNYCAGEREVAGYRCMKATCDFKGRSWTVWYSPDIPVRNGFWKLAGLPGMILSATDATGTYEFEAVGIEQPSHEPLIRYQIPTKRVSRAWIRKAERRIYGKPLDAFYAMTGQNYYIIVQDGVGEIVTEEDDFSIPYAPIEAE